VTRRHLPRLLLASAALALSWAPLEARAQEEGGGEGEGLVQAPVVREHPSLAFARTLGYAYTWFDLAFEELAALEASRPPADVAEQALLLRLELQTTWATTVVKEQAKREEELKKVRAAYEDLVAKKGSSPVASTARLRLGEMLLQEGDGAFARVRQTDDPEIRAQSRKEAEERFKQAEKYFKELADVFEKDLEAADKSGDATKQNVARGRLLTSMFNYARAVYNRAQLFDRGSKDREELLAKGLGLFQEINGEYTDQFLGYEAAIFMGLCAKELAKVDVARAAFDSALGIRDFYPQDDQGRYQLDQDGADIVSRASYFKAQTLNDVGDPDGALAAVKQLFEIMPELARDRLGYAARVEEGKAWGRKGDLKKAQAILEKIMDEDKGGPWAAAAKEQIGLLGGSGTGGLTIAPDRTLDSADALMDKGRVPEGLNQIRNLIATVERAGPGDQEKWLPLAWFRLGKAYTERKRYDEAVACFNSLFTRYKKHDLAPKALFQAAMALSQLNGAKPNEFDKASYLETLKTLQKEYPNDPAAKASSFFLGTERFAARDYVAAAVEFEKSTPQAGAIYDGALYQAAVSHVYNARQLAEEKKDAEAKLAFAKARGALEKAIDWASASAFQKGGVPAEGERASTLRRVAFDARCRLAEVYLHALMKDGGKALAAAAAAESGLGAGADPERIAEARLLQIRAHLAGNDHAKAEAVVASMGTDAGQSPRTAQAEREVAVAFDRLAEDAKKQSADEAKGLFAKAADHYTRWLDLAEKAELNINARELMRAADRLYSLSLVLNGLAENSESFVEVEDLSKLEAGARFTSAARVYQAAIQAGAPDPWLLWVKLGECLGFAQDFEQASKALRQACDMEKLLTVEKEKDEKGKDIEIVSIDVKVAQARSLLLFAYSDYGRCLFELGRKDRKRYDEAIQVTGRVLVVVPPGQSIWWRAKYLLFASLYERGDYDEAGIGMKQLQRQNPSFDGGKYGLKAKFEALAKSLEGKKSPGAGKKDMKGTK